VDIWNITLSEFYFQAMELDKTTSPIDDRSGWLFLPFCLPGQIE